MAWHLSGVTNTSFVLVPTSSSIYGDSVTFTANITVNSPGAGTPGGNVQFFDGVTPLGTPQPISGGAASVVTSTLTAGTYNITAQYLGDTNFNGSTSGILSHLVNKANQTITFGALADKTYGDAAFTVAATASSGLTVSFSSLTGSVCSVAGTTVTMLSGGTCTIRASQPGDTNYNAAPDVDQSFTVNQAPTMTAVVSSANPSVFGSSVTFTATVSQTQGAATPTGSVTFFDGATPLGSAPLNGSAQAMFATSSLAGGNHSITAVYGGDVNYAGSTSGVLTQNVDIAPTANADNYSYDRGESC